MGGALVIEIRLFQIQDVEQVAQLFHETVREVNIRDYSSSQVKAWAPDDIHFRNWIEECSSRFTYVADDDGLIAGFGDLEPNGHIDTFFCHKQYQRCGVGSQIYRAIEAKALELGASRLFTESSITAKPFFQRMGFSIVKEQEIFCRGETFINYAMEKLLLSEVRLTFRALEKDDALAILNWHYAPPYDYYNRDTATIQEDLCYLLESENAYYAILNPQGELEGYCSFGSDAQVPGGDYRLQALDIGMGIRPDLTGQGQGGQFVQSVMKYGAERYGAQKLRVTIAKFNKRAQRVWEKLGFELVGEFIKIGSEEKFVIMTRAL